MTEAEVEAMYMTRCEAYLDHMNMHAETELTPEEITTECGTMWDALWLAVDTSDGAGGDPDGNFTVDEKEAAGDLWEDLSHSSHEHEEMVEAEEMLVFLDTDEDGEVTKAEVEAIYKGKCDDYGVAINAYLETPVGQDEIDTACETAWDLFWLDLDTTADDVLVKDELMVYGASDLWEEYEEHDRSWWYENEKTALDYLMKLDTDETAGVSKAEVEALYMPRCERKLYRSNYWDNIDMTDEEITAACATEWDAWWLAIDTETDDDLSLEEVDAWLLIEGNELKFLRDRKHHG